MPLYVILAATAVIGSIALLVWAVVTTRQPAGDTIAQNLVGVSTHTDLRKARLQRSTNERTLEPLVASMARAARKVTPSGLTDTFDHKLQLAGVSYWGVERVLAAKFGLGLLGGMMGLMVWLGNPTLTMFAFMLGSVSLGFFAPDVVLKGRASRRQETIQRQLSDTLDQITISVEAGLGFEAAMARVAQTGTGPLAEELSRTLQDIQLGVPRREAMEKLVHRTQAEDLQRFVHAMRQAESHGIPIAQVLRVQSAELREKRRQWAEERAMKIPVKITFPVILCIFPTLFIVILGPSLIRIVRDWPS